MTSDCHSASRSTSWPNAVGFIVMLLFWLAPLIALLSQVANVTLSSELFDERWGELLGNTLLLGLGASGIALPIGTLTGIALARCRVVGRGPIQLLILMGMLMPLPVTVVAWQTLLGGWVDFVAVTPGDVNWRNLQQGMLPAMAIHAMAAIPWVVLIVVATLQTVDLDLEDQARLDGNNLIRRVWGPRIKLAMGLSLGWILTQVVTEITVTDAMMVRTLAEDVYTQFVTAQEGLLTVMALTMPLWGLAIALTFGLVRFGRTASSSSTRFTLNALPIPLSSTATIAMTSISWLAATLVGLLPLAAILWKAGGAEDWSVVTIVQQLSKVMQSDGRILFKSLLVSIVVGTLTAWLGCWLLHLATLRRGYAIVILAAALLIVVTPAPVIGLGMKETFNILMDLEDVMCQLFGLKLSQPPIRSLLYDQPSSVPAGWLCVIRFLPVALALQWPALTLIPQRLRESAKLDGLDHGQAWRIIHWPQLRSGFIVAAIIVTALSLGEVGGSKLVNPPSHYSYILWLFDQMHYRSDSTVAALALGQILSSALLVGALWWRLRKAASPTVGTS